MHLYHMRPASTRRARILTLGIVLPILTACTTPPPAPKPIPATTEITHYPPRPTVPPPPFKLFHQDNDTYTLTTRENAADDEIAALLWQFSDAAHAHTFDKLHLSQKFIDARAPKVWFHVYRGPKCAGEKFIKGDIYPCGAAYHGVGDYTLGGFKDPQYEDAVLHKADGTEQHLWDPDAPHPKH